MGGKAILIVVIAFSVMFAVVNFRSMNTTSVAIERLSDYYAGTNAQNIASSAANIAANEFFKNPAWTGFGSTDTIFIQNGYALLDVNNSLGNEVTLTSRGYFEYFYQGEHNVKEALVSFKLKKSSFSKYAYYAQKWPSGGYLVTGDTIDGPFHVQNLLKTLGSPVFLGKTTTRAGYNALGNKWGFGKANPKFLGGYDSPVDVPFTLNTSKLVSASMNGGKNFQDPSGNSMDLRLKFNGNGTVDWSVGKSVKKNITKNVWSKKKKKYIKKTVTTTTTSWSTPISAKLDTLAPNGVIWNSQGNLYLSGTVNGKYTVGTGKKAGQFGNVFLEDDIVYRKDPLLPDPQNKGKTITNPDCEDMLGIVAEKQVVVSDNSANRNDINIHASLFNFDGGITVENIKSTAPNMGKMFIQGGLIESQAQTTGYTNGAGYNQVIKFDKRFSKETPPFFPATEQFEIVSWYE